MNGSIRRATFGITIAIAALGIGSSAAAAGGIGFTTPGSTPPPPPPRDLPLVAPAPLQKSTTCEGNGQCGVLRAACDLVGGTYNGWQSRDPGHGHEHGVCTWPWE